MMSVQVTWPDTIRVWEPSAEAMAGSQMVQFMSRVNARYGMSFSTYAELYAWSVDQTASFWKEVADFCGFVFETPYTSVVDDPYKLPGATWFEGGTLNVAQRLLRFRDDRVALKFLNETESMQTLTYAQLYARVGACAAQFRRMGIGVGDRVAAITTNCPEAIIGFLAAASLGAVWSACSPDFGEKGILDRFSQIEPKVLISVTGYSYHGKSFSLHEKLPAILKQLPTVKQCLIIPNQGFEAPAFLDVPALELSVKSEVEAQDLSFTPLSFQHPLYILYSSGTTGTPKAIVHSAGGAVLQQLKEQMLHVDLRREDTLFYFTTCGWMMWNWLVSGLGVGATLVLYDGSPMYPHADRCWSLIDEAQITVFGTSAKFVASSMEKGISPKTSYQLRSLRAILSTGSPLLEPYFDYLYDHVKPTVQVSSISGGTDIVSCFALGCPVTPVYRGYLQCRGLGMAVDAVDETGASVVNQTGELICRKAAPSMPIYFWNDPDGSRFFGSYFEQMPGVWYHGDFVYLHESGQLQVLGRSDATLNPGGVRIGTSEIYRVVEAIDGIQDSLVVGKKISGDEIVVLFVHLEEGVVLDKALKLRIMQALKEQCSPRHVPRRILAVPGIPYTMNGKKVELAVKRLLEGKSITQTTALKNPEVLAFFTDKDDAD